MPTNAKYTFVPLLKEGMSLSGTIVDDSTGSSPNKFNRATINATLHYDQGGTAGTIAKDLNLHGPGDVIGVKPEAIIRVDPIEGRTDLEPNYLPYIEFYDEDLPWRYTPATPTDEGTGTDHGRRLRPWMTLIVLKDGDETVKEYEELDSVGPLPLINVTKPAEALPPNPAQTLWATAHVQVTAELDTSAFSASLNAKRKSDPDCVISRIVCLRKLEAETAYRAFLVPTFETGRLIGIDQKAQLDPDEQGVGGVEVMQDAFGSTTFPYYHSWRFATGADGDFEELVRRLKPKTMPAGAGTRNVDIRRVKESLEGLEDLQAEEVGIVGALRTLDTDPDDLENGIVKDGNTYDDKTLFKTKLSELINQTESYLEGFTVSSNDPKVTPPLYGRWHRLLSKINADDEGWIADLNLTIRNRVAAGLGGDIVRENQESFMDHAWEQVGEIIKANEKINYACVAREISKCLYDKHLTSFDDEKLLKLTKPMMKRTLMEGAVRKTAFKVTKEANLPNASAERAFNRISRPKNRITATALRTLNENSSGADLTASDYQNSLMVNLNDTSVKEVTTATTKDDSSTEFLTRAGSATDEVSLMEAKINDVQSSGDTSFYVVQRSATNSIARPNLWTDLKAKTYKPEPRGETIPIDKSDNSTVTGKVLDKADPRTSIRDRALAGLSQNNTTTQFADLIPVQAAPHFRIPLYEELAKISSDFIFPGLDKVADNTITLLSTNSEFIESFMVGTNFEMARELLWREYPTDQRGSYFKQFWDVTDYQDPNDGSNAQTSESIENSRHDITEIATWTNSFPFGHETHSPGSGGDKIVLVIRGELIRKYPNVLIYAQKAEERAATPDTTAVENYEHRLLNEDPMDTEKIKYPIFQGQIGDVYLLGFDISPDDVKGPELETDMQDGNINQGYYFIFRERPGQTRFGLDATSTLAAEHTGIPPIDDWNDLSWDEVGQIGDFLDVNAPLNVVQDGDLSPPWNASGDTSVNPDFNAADLAHILYQSPVMVAVHACKMLESV